MTSSLILCPLDIETTGFLDNPDHRIVEVYLALWRGRKKVAEYERRINPQRSMPLDAERVHGISGGMLLNCPTWDQLAPTIHATLSKADVYIWHNGDEFDGPFLDREFKRVGLPGLPEKLSVDTMLQGVWATHDGKKPTLKELCWTLDVPYDESLAHAAAYDVDRMVECFFKALDWGYFELPVQQAAEAA